MPEKDDGSWEPTREDAEVMNALSRSISMTITAFNEVRPVSLLHVSLALMGILHDCYRARIRQATASKRARPPKNFEEMVSVCRRTVEEFRRTTKCH